MDDGCRDHTYIVFTVDGKYYGFVRHSDDVDSSVALLEAGGRALILARYDGVSQERAIRVHGSLAVVASEYPGEENRSSLVRNLAMSLGCENSYRGR